MKLGDLLLPGLVLAAVLVFAAQGSSPSSPGDSPPSNDDDAPTPAPAPAGTQIWSLTPASGERCGVDLVPAVTGSWGTKIVEGVDADLVWGWTPPGDLRLAKLYGKRLIADVEYRPVVPAAPKSAWAGTEVAQAAELGALVGGVTSHGFVPAGLRPVLAQLASRGVIGYPQVYDSDKSAEPRQFLRTCLASWKKAGFATIRPLLGVSAGLPHLAAWLDECQAQGVTPHLWDLQRIQTSKYSCDQLGLGGTTV